MGYKIGDDLKFPFFFTASKLGKTGLTVTIKAAYKNGAIITAITGAAISEVGNGLYRYSLIGATYNDAVGDYIIVATTADSTVDLRDLPCRVNVEAVETVIVVSGSIASIINGVLDSTISPGHDTPNTLGGLTLDTWNIVGSLPDVAAITQNILDSDVTVHNFPNTVGLFINKIFSLDDTIEGTLTLRKIIKLIASALFGKSFGGGTANVGFRDTQDTKNRISATVDANGNRTNVTLDGS